MNEEGILQAIIKHESWEDIIHHIITLEHIDPWDIDLIKLTDSFIRYIEGLRMLDFRIPAKVVLTAAILLKLKSEVLYPFEKEEGYEYVPEGEEEFDEFALIREKLSELTLKPGMRRRVRRKVTLDELINALRKAMRVEKRRQVKKRRLGKRLRKEIGKEDDIEKRIEELMLEIDMLLSKLKSEKVEFSRIVEVWERENIVRYFLPLLHLSTRGKVITEQQKFFDEIFVSKAS